MSEKRHTDRLRLPQVAGVALAGATIFGVYLWLHAAVPGFELPKTLILRLRNTEWVNRIDRIDKRLDHCEKALEDLRVRDEKVYRAVYAMESIPDTVRNAGFVGTDRYAWAEGTGRLSQVSVRLDRLTKKAYVQSLSYDEVDSLARRAGELATHVPAICPIDTDPTTFNLSSTFGYRSDPITGEQKLHSGMDFACPPGNPVYATGDGVVVTADSESSGYGNCIVIDHGFGYKSRYAHLDGYDVSVGTAVARGMQIGTTGRSGRVTGPHLHYEIIYRDNVVNPALFMDLTLDPEDYHEVVGNAGGEP